MWGKRKYIIISKNENKNKKIIKNRTNKIHEMKLKKKKDNFPVVARTPQDKLSHSPTLINNNNKKYDD